MCRSKKEKFDTIKTPLAWIFLMKYGFKYIVARKQKDEP